MPTPPESPSRSWTSSPGVRPPPRNSAASSSPGACAST
jgi:hypothetical protein